MAGPLLLRLLHVTLSSIYRDKESWLVILSAGKPSSSSSQPHEDGPAYHPIVATVSLGSHAVFHYYRYTPEENGDEPMTNGRTIDNTPALSVLLEPRSVIITTEVLYREYLHG